VRRGDNATANKGVCTILPAITINEPLVRVLAFLSAVVLSLPRLKPASLLLAFQGFQKESSA